MPKVPASLLGDTNGAFSRGVVRNQIELGIKSGPLTVIYRALGV